MTCRLIRRLECVCLATIAIAAVPALAVQAARPEVPASGQKARNVIVFLADAAGVSALNAASWLGYGEPLQLRVQHWPNLGLSETSPVDGFVSDSANGMSAIMTGVKTHNGVIAQAGDGARGKVNGTPTKTLVEYAEGHGLATGVITTQSIADATPAATYAHSNDRDKWGEIFTQLFSPRFGDGVDVVFGAGRKRIGEQLAAAGSGFDSLAKRHARPVYQQLTDVPEGSLRPIVVGDALDVRAATLKAVDILSKSPKGYVLVVEWDAHTDDPREGLQNIVAFDKLIADIESRVDLGNTLLLFTADHSFGIQVDGGRRGDDLLAGYAEWKAAPKSGDIARLKNILVNDSHTAEEVAALAIGPGADQVRGYFPNTHLFDVMMNALGWQPDAPGTK